MSKTVTVSVVKVMRSVRRDAGTPMSGTMRGTETKMKARASNPMMNYSTKEVTMMPTRMCSKRPSRLIYQTKMKD